MRKNGLGYKRSAPDSRDVPLYRLNGTSSPPPSSDGLRAFAGPLLDQEDGEGCVGWSFVNGIWARWNYLASLQGLPAVAQPSPLWVWWLARQYEGNASLNEGTYLRDAFKQVAKLGVCPESACKSSPVSQMVGDLPRYAVQPGQAAFQHAIDNRFPFGYYRCDLEGPAMTKIRAMQAMHAGMPFQFGTLVTESFLSLGQHDPLPPPGPDEPIAGGHSLTALYYDERGVYGPNNWQDASQGVFWGNDGWFALSWAYIQWIETSDCWATDAGLPAKGWS